MAKFANDHPKRGGRKAGVPNRLTRTVKEGVLDVFNGLQADPKYSLEAFAKKNLKDFYYIAAKLIPTEISGKLDNDILIRFTRENGNNSPAKESPSGPAADS